MRFSSLPFACFARRSAPVTSLALAAVLAFAPQMYAQDAAAPQTPAATAAAPDAQSSSSSAQTTQAAPDDTTAQKKHKWIQKDEPANGSQQKPAKAAAAPKPEKKNKLHIAKDERVVQTKDTRAELRREQKYNPLAGKDASLPDKQLYDKALVEEKKGHFDVARLDLQTLLNTYPESQYLMRSKLAVANSWFQEGGSAAMAQAEQEYGDFITFFPNAPEAGEAQMRMGDIYMKQMDVPDRDYANALKAEEQYRLMLKTYPDAPPVVRKEAEQKLRDVQEVLAQREFELGQFYQQRSNLPASIARYQTVADTYPQFSHMDDVLIGLGDAYETDANTVRRQVTCTKPREMGCLSEAAKERLLEQFDGKAAAYYRDVVLNHAAALHAEDAKERLQAMNLPLPTPTAQQVAASDALEGSRAQYTMRKRLELLLVRKPDTVTAAQMGIPPLDDAAPTVAPTVRQAIIDDFRVAQDPAAAKEVAARGPATPVDDAAGSASPVQPATSGASATLSLSDPSTETRSGSTDSGTVTEVEPAGEAGTSGGGASVGGGGASLGAEVLTPGASSGTATPGTMTGAPVSGLASDAPAATGKADPNYGLVSPKPAIATPLPAAEAPAVAPDAINEAAGTPQPAAEKPNPNSKKKPKPEYDKNDESSSKHKKKKGVDKLNPF